MRFDYECRPIENLWQQYRDFIFSLESVSDFIDSYGMQYNTSFWWTLRERKEAKELQQQKRIEKKRQERGTFPVQWSLHFVRKWYTMLQ